MVTVALVWGILAFLGFCLGLIPCLGWLNWFTIPFGFVGMILGVIAAVQSGRERRPSGAAIAAVVLSAIAVGLGAVRLFLGGGIL